MPTGRVNKLSILAQINRINHRLEWFGCKWRLSLHHRYDYYVVETQSVNAEEGRSITAGNFRKLTDVLYGLEEGILLLAEVFDKKST